MSPAKRLTVSRRGFLAEVIAASAATGVFALSPQVGSAAPWPLETSMQQSAAAHTDHAAPTIRAAATSTGITPASAQTAPTIVLVHGAFADSSSWNPVIARLFAQGHPVVAVVNPLRGLTADGAYVASVLQSIPGPIVLVGHSYGGAVITNAATGNSNVVSLVYVAGWAPDEGERTRDLGARFPGSEVGSVLAPPVSLPGGGVEQSIMQDKFWQTFAPDIPEADAKLAAATQRPIAAAAFSDVSGPPAWKTIPSRFIYGDQDKIIVPAVHAFLAERSGSLETVAVSGASHVVMLSRPDEVTEMINQAVLAHTTAPTGGNLRPS